MHSQNRYFCNTCIYDPQSSQYPYVAKSRQGFAGDGTRIISSPDDETKHQTFLTRPDVFLQRAVSGCTEYAAHFLISGGRVHFQRTICHQMALDMTVKGQAAATKLRSRPKMEEPFAPIFAEILASLDFRGPACIDYKIEAGQPKIMEINPRIGGSILRHISPFLDAYCAALGLVPHISRRQQVQVERRRRWSRRWRRLENALGRGLCFVKI